MNLSQIGPALDSIRKMIRDIKAEGPEDEAAFEWMAHLESVRLGLEMGRMTVLEAEESLGVSL